MSKSRKQHFESLTSSQLANMFNSHGLSVCSEFIRNNNINGKMFLDMDKNMDKIGIKNVCFQQICALVKSINEPETEAVKNKSSLKKSFSFSGMLSKKNTAQNLMLQLKNKFMDTTQETNQVQKRIDSPKPYVIYNFTKEEILEDDGNLDDVYETVNDKSIIPERVDFRRRDLPPIPSDENPKQILRNNNSIYIESEKNTNAKLIPKIDGMQDLVSELKNNRRFNQEPKKLFHEKSDPNETFTQDNTKEESKEIVDMNISERSNSLTNIVQHNKSLMKGDGVEHNKHFTFTATEENISKRDINAVEINIESITNSEFKSEEMGRNKNKPNTDKIFRPVLNQFRLSTIRRTFNDNAQEEFIPDENVEISKTPPPLPVKPQISIKPKNDKLTLIRKIEKQTISFHDVNRESATKILAQCDTGSFFFRKSHKYFCILTIKGPNRQMDIHNIGVIKRSGVSCLDLPGESKLFINLKELLNYYILNGFEKNSTMSNTILKQLIDVQDYCD